MPADIQHLVQFDQSTAAPFKGEVLLLDANGAVVADSSSSLIVDKGDYNWTIYSAEGNYTLGPWRRFSFDPWGLISKMSSKKHFGEGTIRFGYQALHPQY